eukprot:6054269-Pleurochrysis_carterae.AAC.1
MRPQHHRCRQQDRSCPVHVDDARRRVDVNTTAPPRPLRACASYFQTTRQDRSARSRQDQSAHSWQHRIAHSTDGWFRSAAAEARAASISRSLFVLIERKRGAPRRKLQARLVSRWPRCQGVGVGGRT